MAKAIWIDGSPTFQSESVQAYLALEHHNKWQEVFTHIKNGNFQKAYIACLEVPGIITRIDHGNLLVVNPNNSKGIQITPSGYLFLV
jgi:hypothetical protein